MKNKPFESEELNRLFKKKNLSTADFLEIGTLFFIAHIIAGIYYVGYVIYKLLYWVGVAVTYPIYLFGKYIAYPIIKEEYKKWSKQ